MTTTLKHEATNFSMVIDGMKIADIMKEAVTADRKIGQTALRELIKGNVSSSCGFTILAEEAKPKVEETPADKANPAVEILNDGSNEKVNEMKQAAVAESKAGRRSMKTEAKKPRITMEEVKAALPNIHWGKYDCVEHALEAKTKRLTRKFGRIAHSSLFDLKSIEVILNSVTHDRKIVDSFEIHDSKGHLYTVVPKKRGDEKAEAEVLGRENDFSEPLCHGSWSKVVEYFMGAKAEDAANESSPETPETTGGSEEQAREEEE